jgi:hypothetical protein
MERRGACGSEVGEGVIGGGGRRGGERKLGARQDGREPEKKLWWRGVEEIMARRWGCRYFLATKVSRWERDGRKGVKDWSILGRAIWMDGVNTQGSWVVDFIAQTQDSCSLITIRMLRQNHRSRSAASSTIPHLPNIHKCHNQEYSYMEFYIVQGRRLSYPPLQQRIGMYIASNPTKHPPLHAHPSLRRSRNSTSTTPIRGNPIL